MEKTGKECNWNLSAGTEKVDAKMKIKPKNIIILLFIVFLLSAAGSAVNANPKDNAYHYMKNGIDDQLYNEWWHFNGREDGTHFMITFFLTDPDNLTSFRRIQVQAVLLQEGQPPMTGSHQSR